MRYLKYLQNNYTVILLIVIFNCNLRFGYAQANKSEAKKEFVWHNATTLTVEGKGWSNGLARFYDRLPAKAENKVPEYVWKFSRESAGMSVRFITDAQTIHIRYRLLSPDLSHSWGDLSNMAASGFDLYAQVTDTISGKNNWHWVGGNKPTKQNNSDCLAVGLAPGQRLFQLNLPVYNGVEFLEIGVPFNSAFETPEPREEPPIVFYGTSIMQGGVASRPGLNIPAVIGRRLDSPVVNLGFCGCGRMDEPVVELLAELNPSVYVIDCLPNMDMDMVTQRAEPLVNNLRKVHPETPILLVEEHDHPSPDLFPGKKKEIQSKNKALQLCYEKLKLSGCKNLYYLSSEGLIGEDSEGTGDGIHPNDLGMSRYITAYEKALRAIVISDDF